MAYVPDYSHDVFVSYAHLDNQGEMAWVTNLVRHLETETSARLGTKDLRISIDHDLDGNRPLTPEIMERIHLSATLLVIMSPGYIASSAILFSPLPENVSPTAASSSSTAGRSSRQRCRANSAT